MDSKIIHWKELLNYNTPNTYGENFAPVPKKCGVYFFVKPITRGLDLLIGGCEYYEIIYIGSSRNLYNRYSSHHLRRKNILGMRFYFIERIDFYNDEIKLINHFKPIYNIQHNSNYKK